MPSPLSPVPSPVELLAAEASSAARKVSVLVVVGTRPEAIKLIPIITPLEGPDAVWKAS